MVLRDTLFENMSYAQWMESLRPKVQGSWNLHSFMPQDLDFFVCLSSFSGIFGNRGQSNYAAGGTYEDGLAHFRRSKGLKAVTIDLGIMRDVGVLAEKGAVGDLREWEEPFGIREFEFHALMKKAIYGQLVQNGEGAPAQIVTGIPTGEMVAKAGIRRPFYFDDAKFGIMARTGHQQGAATSTDGAASLKDQLASVESVADASKVVAEALVAKVAKSLQTPTSEIDTRRPLHSYGVDSLVAVEIRNWIMKEMKSDITVFDIMASVPMTTFAQNITVKSKLFQEKIA
jgi:zearalenone synthase (highly reducing iterative type I polyketide synthase)